jgi:hypothetical protein
VKHESDILHFISPDYIEEQEETQDTTREKNKTVQQVFGSVLEVGYADIIRIMMDQHTKNNCKFYDGEDVICLNSFDGAEAFKNHKETTSVISFSSSLISSKTMNERKITAVQSNHILTWL